MSINWTDFDLPPLNLWSAPCGASADALANTVRHAYKPPPDERTSRLLDHLLGKCDVETCEHCAQNAVPKS